MRSPIAALGIVLFLLTSIVSAQTGQIAGTVRDQSGSVLPGVTVEVSSPALIEKTRVTTTDADGRYRLTALPAGTYTVTFTLSGFTTVRREQVILTGGVTAPVDATMAVGALAEAITVIGEAPIADEQNARQVTVFQGAEVRDLPTARNVPGLLALTRYCFERRSTALRPSRTH